MQLTGKIINFLGDSITYGHGVSDPQRRFTQLIQEDCHLLRANNYGISGTRIARQTQPSDPSFDQDFPSRVERMDLDADLIVVFGGTNDFGHGDAPLGCPSDRGADTFSGSCHVLMRRLITRYPGKPVVICTPLHRLGEDSLFGDGSKAQPAAPLVDYVDVLRRTARHYALPVLDLYAVSGIQPELEIIRERFCPDGLHPNDAGHRLLADRMIGFLQSL
ncbi:MAG: SGNH/GDSL hydrolase family protein [Christensenellales bacterium]|jgi:lysophospholipase L1-like esterase